MSTVTQRIGEIRQPRGGYIKPSQFTARFMDDGNGFVEPERENVHPSVVGMSVDYLTRYLMGAEIQNAFSISILGARSASMLTRANMETAVRDLLSGIQGMDDTSIINACKMTTFDVWYRNPMAALQARTAADTNPNADTIRNIRIMLERSLTFWQEYGPITKDGFTFEEDGYTEVVDSGDGDFLTKDTMWDFKVSKSKPTSKHTLQLLMYWIMGQHSGKPEFKGITRLGIFNPRPNAVYTLEMSKVPAAVIHTVENEVICY
ncbi:MAG: hypothetical protein IJT31_06770 [Oscillibacter sp.]|nr:hypothetical protein [Oscillibacter sp.]